MVNAPTNSLDPVGRPGCALPAELAALLGEDRPLLCERVPAVFALLVLPLDLIRLLWPCPYAAAWKQYGSLRRGRGGIVLLSLSVWTAVAALVCALTSIAVHVQYGDFWTFEPRDPFDPAAGAHVWLAEYFRDQPNGLLSVLAFAGAFAIAPWALAGALTLLLNRRGGGGLDSMQIARRTVLAFSPVVCVMAAGGIATLLTVSFESLLPIAAWDEPALNACALACAIALFFAWLAVMGSVEGGAARTRAYQSAAKAA